MADSSSPVNSAGSSLKAEFTKKEQIRCLMCGGKDCSKCGLDAYKVLPNPAIAFLHSHWINESIVAMQRPNNIAFDNGALKDMVSKKITAVFNLTQPGEHPYCGCGVLSASGFPYSPEKLMHAGIKHFNFCWQDMTVPTLHMMMDIVHIAVNELSTGGKIAVHCHAGFGRTGLAIACILIAKDLLECSQVIQFVRLRRPGSIQTSAQQDFVQRFERAWFLRMQIFPVLEIDANAVSKKGAAAKAPSMHVKSIKTSVHDQQYFLTHSELISHKYKYMHKLTHYTTTALRRLSHEHFIIACLAVTGLTRLTIKKNLELEPDDKSRPANGGPGMVMHQKSGRKLLKKKSSFMVATNSLSESSEENILNEIKIELNSNRFTRLFSLAEVLNLDINSDAEPVKKPMKPPGSSFLVIRKDLSEGRMSGRDDEDTKPPSLSPPSTPPAMSPSSKLSARSPSAGQYISPHLPTVEEQSEVKSSIPDRALSFAIKREDLVEDVSGQANDQTATNETGKDSEAGMVKQSPHEPNNASKLTTMSNDSQISQTPSEALTVPPPIVTAPLALSRSIDEERHHSSASSPAHSGRLPGIDTRSNSAHSNIGQNSFSKQHSSNSNSSGPGNMSRGTSDRSSNRSVGNSSLSMSKLRANSLRQISEVELAKSRKMAVNMIAQLLLDWLETRQDPIFNEHVVEKLSTVWKNHTKQFSSPQKAQSVHHSGQDEYSLHLPVIAHRPRSRPSDSQSREHSFNSRSLNGMRQQSDSMAKEDAEHGTYLDPFNTSVKTDPSAELISDISRCIHAHLDRCHLELLKSIVSTYRELRRVGQEIARHTEQQQAAAKASAALAAGMGMPGMHKVDQHALGMEEYEALEALVGLRFAIACMHARKSYQGLIRQRALIIDLVKVFLLKSTASELVIINNITFSEESYEHVKNNIGSQVIFQLDVVFRTLRLLAEQDDHKPLDSPHPTVSWQPDFLPKDL